MSVDQDVQQQYAELNAKYLPPEAGTCRLQLLRHVQGLRTVKDLWGGFTSHGFQRVERPSNFEQLSQVEQNVIFNEDDRLRYRRTVDDVMWLRTRLPELYEQVGLPAELSVIEDVEVGSPAMCDMVVRKDNWYAFANRAERVFDRELLRIEDRLQGFVLGVELPERWEPSEYSDYPMTPVRSPQELVEYLQHKLWALNQTGRLPVDHLLGMQRELRNARRVVKQFIKKGDIQVNDTPATVHDAEREMERLIEVLEATFPANPSPYAAVNSIARIGAFQRIQRDILTGELPSHDDLPMLQASLKLITQNWVPTNRMSQAELGRLIEEQKLILNVVELLAHKLGQDSESLMSDIVNGEGNVWVKLTREPIDPSFVRAKAVQDDAPEVPPPEEDLATEVIMDDVCLRILTALDGRSLTLRQLANEVSGGENSVLYRSGLKKILIASGQVLHTKKTGYYRPDKPPLNRLAKVAKVSAK
jgi:hypothetical protein